MTLKSAAKIQKRLKALYPKAAVVISNDRRYAMEYKITILIAPTHKQVTSLSMGPLERA